MTGKSDLEVAIAFYESKLTPEETLEAKARSLIVENSQKIPYITCLIEAYRKSLDRKYLGEER